MGGRIMKPGLKITSVDIYKSDIELKEPFRIAIMEVRRAQSLFIRVNTNQEIYGLGEANPTWGITGETQSIDAAGAADLAKLILGRDPSDIENRTREIDRFLARNSTLRSAFDMALYDILGKAAGLPLYALIGGGRRSFWTDNTIGIADSDSMAEKAADYKNQGFQAIKVKLGTTPDQDIQRIQKIREAIGYELPIRIDANQGWNYRTAVTVLKSLEPLGIEYCEQPVAFWDYENMRRIRQNTSIAIMADESLFDHHDAFKLASMGCCDYFNIKLAKAGGIHTALKINSVAESSGIRCMLGCMMETRLGLTAAAHVVSARPNICYADLDGYLSLKDDPIIGGAQYKIGEINLPETPGHGADVDTDFLKDCEQVTIK
jgi:L-alanine-DL-glutamate epimerase-like enolase superfamily enzyme